MSRKYVNMIMNRIQTKVGLNERVIAIQQSPNKFIVETMTYIPSVPFSSIEILFVTDPLPINTIDEIVKNTRKLIFAFLLFNTQNIMKIKNSKEYTKSPLVERLNNEIAKQKNPIIK